VTIYSSAQVDAGENLQAAQKRLDEARETNRSLQDKADEAAKAAKTAADDMKEAAEAAAKAARAEADEAAANVAALEKNRDAARSAAATGKAGGLQGEVTYKTTIDKDTAQTISNAVVRIVTLVFEDDEVERRCIDVIPDEPETSKAKAGEPETISKFCEGYLIRKLVQDQILQERILDSSIDPGVAKIRASRGQYGNAMLILLESEPQLSVELYDWIISNGYKDFEVADFLDSPDISDGEKKAAFDYLVNLMTPREMNNEQQTE